MNTEKEFNSGALIDDRLPEVQAKDFTFEEIVAQVDPVNWVQKDPKDWRTFPIFDQDGSGSCVAQTAAKLLGINYWLKNGTYVHFSATHIYQRRSNKPGGGMIATNCFDIMREGTTLEALVPSQDMNDKEMDGIEIPEYKEDVGEIFKIKNYVSIASGDIDKIASIIQKTGKGVMVWFYFKHNEWGKDVPEVKYPDLKRGDASRHSVSAVDFTLYNGKKALIIEDSWGPGTGKGGRRIITEDFFNQRNWFAGYALDFTFVEAEEEGTKPRFIFKKNLYYTSKVSYGDHDVIALQNCLKYLGLFPKNVSSTGYFGALTKKAVQDFQTSQKITADGIVGPVTRAKLNTIFA